MTGRVRQNGGACEWVLGHVCKRCRGSWAVAGYCDQCDGLARRRCVRRQEFTVGF